MPAGGPPRPQRPPRPQSPPVPAALGSAASPVSAPPVARPAERYRELDGHRGIAAVAIVVFHVYQFCNVAHFLYLGTPAYTVLNSLDAMVPWFFVISAFLLFEPVARSVIEGQPPISARGFGIRRALRILPAYYVAVVVVWFSRQRTLPGDWRDLVEHLTFTQVFDGKRIFYTIGPAWSLSVEVFFYLALLIFALGLPRICRRLASRKQRIAVLAASTAALTAASLCWKAWSFWGEHRPTTGSFTTWFGPMASFDAFAVGMAVAIFAAAQGGRRPLGSRVRLALRLAALAIVSVAFAIRQANAWSGVYFSTLCAAGFGGLVAAAVLGPLEDRWGRALSCRPLLGLGAISYSIYLWHEPVLLALAGWEGLVRQAPGAFVADTAMVLVVSILAGWLSYSLIERPASQLGRVFGRDGQVIRSAQAGSPQTTGPLPPGCWPRHPADRLPAGQ
ncbi:MAG: acyltransferase [Actinomycetota bacterium]|nr:acyltransferase [Actinomycetota bacterium]